MKKIISIFLVAAMMICSMPASVMAADDSDAAPCIVAKTVASEKNTLTVSWTECDGASEYVVYANKCNTKGHKYSLKQIATIAATEDTSYTIKKINGKKLTKNTFYKVRVIAVDADGDNITASRIMYVATGGYKGEYGNTTKLSAKSSSILIGVGETKKVGTETYKVYKNKKAATNKAAKLRYLSSNKYIATVDEKGNVSGVRSGNCTIYMQAPNGLWAETKVSVAGEDTASVDPKVVNIDEKRAMLADYILPWDSSEKEHDGLSEAELVITGGEPGAKAICSITVGDGSEIPYEDFEEAWVAANTTYKNKGNIVFRLYADWVADENGNFGTDSNAFLGGGLHIKGWKKNVTIDLNGYKMDRNLTGDTISNGFVIKVQGNSKSKVYIKNGCVTGGGNTNDGGGIIIYGDGKAYVQNMIVTGNVSGRDGGGIYFGSYATVSLYDTRVEGNYAEEYGGGAYADYNYGATYININELKGVVTIQNNKGVNNRNNLTFEFSKGTCYQSPYIHKASNLSKGSAVYVSCSQENSEGRLIVREVDYNARTHKYFYLDGDEWEFVILGEQLSSGWQDYLGIKKNNG